MGLTEPMTRPFILSKSKPKSKDILDASAHSEDITDSQTKGIGSKSQLLAEIFAKDDIYKMGAEFRLFTRLMFADGGRLSSTKEGFGQLIGSDYRAAVRYIETLEKADFVSADTQGKKITVTLTEPYLSVARMPDDPLPTSKSIPLSITDPEFEKIKLIYETAKETGQELTVTLSPLEIKFGAAG